MFPIRLVVIFPILLSSLCFAKVDSSIFNGEKRKKADQKVKFNFGDSANDSPTVEILDHDLTFEVIDLRIKSFTSIIKSEDDSSKIIDILISRATLYLQKANLMRDGKTVGSQISDKEKSAFKASEKDLIKVIASKKATPNQLSYAYYLFALINVDLGKTKLAFENFSSALKYNPKSQYAAGIVFFMSEHYFKKGDSDKSFEILSKNLSVMKGSDYSLALYKIAWSLVGSGKKFMAEKYFKKLLVEAGDSSAAQAATREIALVSSEIRSEAELVEMAEKLFSKTPSRKLEFLSTAYSNYRRVNPNFRGQILFARLIKIANTPAKRINLWINEMKASDRDYASDAQLSAFISLKGELESMSSSKRESLMDQYSQDVETEVSRLIGSYLKTYSGEISNQEELSKKQLSQALLQQLEFYARYFSNSNKIKPVFELWMDISLNTKNYKELLRVSQRILADSRFESLSDKAELNRIRSLDKLADGKDVAVKNELYRALNKYLEDRKKPQWREFANYQADLLFEINKNEAAMDWLGLLHRRYNDQESLIRLIKGHFQVQEYQQILGLVGGKKITNPEVEEILRESNLQLAIQNKDENKNAYQKHIKSYLKLTKDDEKKILVLSDYYAELINQKKWNLLYSELRKQELAWTNFTEAIEKMSRHLYLHRKWKPLSDFLHKLPNIEKSQNLLYRKLVLDYALYRKFVKKDFLKLDSANQVYLLQNLTISNPKYALSFIEGRIEKLPSVKPLATLALQVKCQNFLPTEKCRPSTSYEKKLISQLEKQDKTKAESIIDRIAFPKSIKSLDANLLKIANQVRLSRSKVGESLQNADYHVKLRSLSSLQKAELKVANLISTVNAPKNMSAKEKTSFLKELEELANEFKGQSSNYTKIRNDLSDSFLGKSSTRSPASLSTFRWPSDKNWAKSLKKINQKYDTFSTLLYLDELKSLGLSKEVFHRMRAVIMSGEMPNPVLKRFFIEEFKSEKLKGLEEKWRGL